MLTTIILCISIGFVALYSISINTIILKLLPLKQDLRILVSLVIAPLLLGLITYILYFLFPSFPRWFYIAIIFLLSTIMPIVSKFKLSKSSATIRRIITLHYQTFLRLDKISKLFISIICFIILLVMIRMIFWPINWADQIYYIEQSYVFGQLHSLDLFRSWGFFSDDVVFHQMNPAIRPGLPMIFNLPYLFGGGLTAGILFAQLTMFYFFIILCISVYYTSSRNFGIKSGIYSLFLMLTTYLFIYHSISGFKEMIIITITILLLNIISNYKLISYKLLTLIGIMMGLMSFVNYSGILISAMVLLTLLLYCKEKIYWKVSSIVFILCVMFLMSGFEIISFYKFISLGLKPTNQQAPLSVIVKNINNQNLNNVPEVVSKPVAVNEINGYNITNESDIYTKGKFQGLFQIEYYGLIFWLLLLIATIKAKHIWRDRNIRAMALFSILYYLIIYDPFSLNPHQYSHVLSLSNKYTTLLIPIVAIIICSHIEYIYTLFGKFKPLYILITSILYILTHFLYIQYHYRNILDVITLFIPIHQNLDYYQSVIIKADRLVMYVAIIIVLTITSYYYYNRSQANMKWLSSHYSFIILMNVVFLLPFIFFFNTNIGFSQTFKHTFSNKSTKLSNIIGWEGLYETTNYINALAPDQHILFINQSIELVEIHLTFPVKNIDSFEYLDRNNDKSTDNILQQYNYIFAKKSTLVDNEILYDKKYVKPVVSYNGDVLYKVEL